MIDRTFNDIPDGKVNDADQQSFLVSLGWSRGDRWNDLLSSKRVLIISEAGAGKLTNAVNNPSVCGLRESQHSL